MPPPRCSPIPVPGLSPGISPRDQGNDCYDVPPRAVPVGNESFRNCPRCSPAPSCVSPISRESGEAYDVPRSLLTNPPLTPSSSASSLTADSHSFSSSNRSSLANMPDYDVPRPHNRVPPPHANYDVPLSQQTLKELPLELSSALETLERLETDTLSATSKLLGFVSPNWRTREKLETNRMDIKLVVTRLRTSLHDLAQFGEGALGNAAKASDKNLVVKLTPLVSALRKSDSLVQGASEALEKHQWSLSQLARPETPDKTFKPDELEHLVACARALTEDVRQIASFIQGNATLLFKKDQSAGTTTDWTEEYDYVSFDSKENVSKQNNMILNELPKGLKKGFENCVKHADDASFEGELPHDDKQLLKFFSAQIVTHHTNLTHAIDAFLNTVERNQPPKIFLAHGKFVVLSAHKLVHIGDTVHRNISSKHIKERALSCSNALSDALATSVNKTKQAAVQFPLVSAVQEMVDSIVDISHLAKDLKVCLVQAAHPL